MPIKETQNVTEFKILSELKSVRKALTIRGLTMALSITNSTLLLFVTIIKIPKGPPWEGKGSFHLQSRVHCGRVGSPIVLAGGGAANMNVWRDDQWRARKQREKLGWPASTNCPVPGQEPLS